MLNELLLERLSELQEVELALEKLKQERTVLRLQIQDLLQAEHQERYSLSDGMITYKLSLRKSDTFSYDWPLLERRLGERFLSLLEPDYRLFKPYKHRVHNLLLPILDKVGKITRRQVEIALELGIIENGEIEDAEQVIRKRTLYVQKV